MTKQELYTCDVCFDDFKVPLHGIVHMTLIYNGETQFDGDLCPDCHELFTQWREDVKSGRIPKAFTTET